MQTELEDRDSLEFARRVREELARRRMSRQALADQARISLSTLEKALAGTRSFTLASKLRVEEAFGHPFASGSTLQNSSVSAAPDRLGAYVRAAVRWLEGRYLTIRPSFGTADALFAYVTEIQWRDELGHLVFAEQQRTDCQFQQRGEVSLPNLSGHIYLVTNDSGQHRLIILSRPTISGSMYGVLTTLEVGAGSQLVPASCPIVLIPLAREDEPPLGVVTPGMNNYDEWRARLLEVTQKDFARFRQLFVR